MADLATHPLRRRPEVLGLRVAIVAVVLVVSVVILSRQLSDLAAGEVITALARISALQWLAAGVCTFGSFAALGFYDAFVHRWFRTGIATRHAVISGASSIAVAQFLGFGLVTGTLARWRMLPELTLAQAAGVTVAVGASFMLALLAMIALVLPFQSTSDPVQGWVALGGAAVFCSVVALSLLQPAALPFKVPSLRVITGISVAAILDTTLAGLALWVLLPSGMVPGPVVVVGAYLLALGAGLLGTTPGGAGPFELTLLMSLSSIPEPELLAAILGFRLVYYAAPAVLATIPLLIRPQPLATASAPEHRATSLANLTESGLVRQGEFVPLDLASSSFIAAETGQALVALRDPVAAFLPRDVFLEDLKGEAQARGLVPALYKCSPRTAAIARSHGWRTTHIADDCWLDTEAFTLATPKRRQLRRKLRGTEAAGLKVTRLTAPYPLDQMREISNEWAAGNGGERGFSMGRWCPRYVADQTVFAAWSGGQIVAFASFHTGRSAWALDLMRSRADAPNGAMHAIIVAAVEAAQAAGIPRLSLAALPSHPSHPALAFATQRMAGPSGLRQFKLSFAPRTAPLYLAAPTWPAMALAAFDVFQRVHRPKPLGEPAMVDAASTENYATHSA